MHQLLHNSNRAIPHSAFRVPHSKSAFTLVELLIVIAIIGVLTAMSLSLLGAASNDAKVSATQARMSQITAILQLQMEDYEVRRLPVSNRILRNYVAANPIMIDGKPDPMNARLQLQYLRRQVLMALIDSELPRPARILTLGQPIAYVENEFAGQFGSRLDLAPESAFAQTNIVKHIDEQNVDPALNVGPAFFVSAEDSFFVWLESNYPQPVRNTRLTGLLNGLSSSSAVKFRRQVDDTTAQGALDDLDLPGEYLHEILRSIQVDGQSAVESLGSSAIANTDNDRFPEVVDAWGEPLLFDIEQFGSTIDLCDNSVRANGLGVVPLDPRYPMALGDLQIVVGSNRIPESLPVVERISRGIE